MNKAVSLFYRLIESLSPLYQGSIDISIAGGATARVATERMKERESLLDEQWYRGRLWVQL